MLAVAFDASSKAFRAQGKSNDQKALTGK